MFRNAYAPPISPPRTLMVPSTVRRSPLLSGPDPALELLRSRVLSLAADSEPARREAYDALKTTVVWAKFQASLLRKIAVVEFDAI